MESSVTVACSKPLLVASFLFLHVCSATSSARHGMLLWFQEVDHRQRFYFRRSPADELQRTRLALPRDSELEDLLQECGIEVLRGRSRDHSELAIHGLLLLEFGGPFRGPLTSWSWEARLLRRYLLSPLDCFDLRIAALRYLEEPIIVTSTCTNMFVVKAGRGGRNVHSWAFIPVLNEDVLELPLQGGGTVGELMSALAPESDPQEVLQRMPCLRVIDAIAQLARQGRWSHLVGCVRWHALTSILPEIAEVPSTGPWHEPHHSLESCQMTAARMDALAYRLRAWAPLILAGVNGDEDEQALL